MSKGNTDVVKLLQADGGGGGTNGIKRHKMAFRMTLNSQIIIST